MMPSSSTAAISSEVAIGRWMKMLEKPISAGLGTRDSGLGTRKPELPHADAKAPHFEGQSSLSSKQFHRLCERVSVRGAEFCSWKPRPGRKTSRLRSLCLHESRVPRNSPLLRLALRAIGCADVRSGILPPQSESGQASSTPPSAPAALGRGLIWVVVGGAGTSPGFSGVIALPSLSRNWPAVTTRSPALRPEVMMVPVSPAPPPTVTGCILTYLAGLSAAGAPP